MPLETIQFHSRTIGTGQDVTETGRTPLQRFRKFFSRRDQVAVYNPSRHTHIASGVTRRALTGLKQLSPRDGAFSNHSVTETASRLLKAAGIDTDGINDPAHLHFLSMKTLANPAWAKEIAGLTRSGINPIVVERIATLAETSPRLAVKLTELATQEKAGNVPPGASDYMTKVAINDPYMADLASGRDPARFPNREQLGFEPKFHFQLDSKTYNEVKEHLQYLQSKSIFQRMKMDDEAETIHSGYTYQAFEQILRGLPRDQGEKAAHIRTAFHKAAGISVFSKDKGLILEKAFGDPRWSAHRQDTRFQTVSGMYTDHAWHDYVPFDRCFFNAQPKAFQASLDKAPDTQTRIARLLENVRGFAISENHSEIDAKQFLATQLDTLKNQGVRVIAIEHFKHSVFSDLLDGYFSSGGEDDMSAELQAALRGADRNPKAQAYFMEIVKKAKESGLRIVCADTENLRSSRDEVHGSELRVASMNHFAESAIRNSLRPGEKFVILAGSAHNNTHRGLVDGVPGFSQLFMIPAVKIESQGDGGFKMKPDLEDRHKRSPATPEHPR